jgi:hypothetical protein
MRDSSSSKCGSVVSTANRRFQVALAQRGNAFVPCQKRTFLLATNSSRQENLKTAPVLQLWSASADRVGLQIPELYTGTGAFAEKERSIAPAWLEGKFFCRIAYRAHDCSSAIFSVGIRLGHSVAVRGEKLNSHIANWYPQSCEAYWMKGNPSVAQLAESPPERLRSNFS